MSSKSFKYVADFLMFLVFITATIVVRHYSIYEYDLMEYLKGIFLLSSGIIYFKLRLYNDLMEEI